MSSRQCLAAFQQIEVMVLGSYALQGIWKMKAAITLYSDVLTSLDDTLWDLYILPQDGSKLEGLAGLAFRMWDNSKIKSGQSTPHNPSLHFTS